MKLKDYIDLILKQTPPMTEVVFEVSLWPDATVADNDTGNRCKFTVFKGDDREVKDGE